VLVPLNSSVTYEQTKPIARALAEQLERQHPELVLANMRRSLREGKVLIDWSQNDDHKTTVCAYSLRAKDRPTVSAPLTWEEVEAHADGGDPEDVLFTADEVRDRLEDHGDLFGPVAELQQTLPQLA
jgi:bifunctional non-homologous end joining protein LigD